MPKIVNLSTAATQKLPYSRGKAIQIFDPSNGTKNLDIHLIVLNPGIKRGDIHYHKKMENVYVVLEGRGKIIDDEGKEYRIRAGQAVFLAPGETHGLFNTGRSHLRLIEVYAPPGEASRRGKNVVKDFNVVKSL